MTDPIQILLQQQGIKTGHFPPNSRYYGLELATLEAFGGKPIAYIRRRLIPPPEQFELLLEHLVTQGDRLDNIASQYLGDPEQFWRICDANAVIDPHELTDAEDRIIRITLPEGIARNL